MDLLVIAGEHSGDEHAAAMVHELTSKRSELAVCALGGGHLAAAGARLVFDLVPHSVVGLVEVLRHYSFFRQLLDETVEWIAAHQPRVLCLVDYPGFNLRLAAELAARGLTAKTGGVTRVVFYIGPQIWAWKRHRRFRMAELLDALAVIFPFEVDCYSDTNLPVSFVGHPFTAPDSVSPVRFADDGPVLLLPGSRVQAVARILPVLLDGYRKAFETIGRRPAVILCASETLQRQTEAVVGEVAPSLPISIQRADSVDSLAASAVLTSSGTMSLRVALAGIPGAIVYRAHPLTYCIGRCVVGIRWLGIANILLGRSAWPEYIQGAAKPQALAAELRDCLGQPSRRETAACAALALRETLSVEAGRTAASWLSSFC